jgi:hypothetical protein
MRDDAIVTEDNSTLAGSDVNELPPGPFTAEYMAHGLEALSDEARR